MESAVVLRGGARVYRVGVGGRVEGVAPIAPDPGSAALAVARGFPEPLSRAILELGRSPPGSPVVVEPGLAAAFSRGLMLLRSAPVAELRAAREALPPPERGEERRFLLQLADERLRLALQDPEEILIALAREEERVERTVGRETAAAGHWLSGDSRALVGYAQGWTVLRGTLDRHHATLVELLESTAQQVAPNLSELVGPRVTARLVAAAGGRAALARMSAPRLQLLGAKRRSSGGRGPRYGLLFRAARMADVPLDRGGAYARSLAALAVIAARADLRGTRLGPMLAARRDRRVERLQRRKS